MIGISLNIWRGGGGGSSLARPTEPAFSAAPGAGPGAVTLTVTALPVSWGDAVEKDDGLGEAGILQWWNPVTDWQTLVDPVPDSGDLPEEYPIELPESLWGETITIRVRGVNNVGLTGAAATDTVEVPAAQVWAWEDGMAIAWEDEDFIALEAV